MPEFLKKKLITVGLARLLFRFGFSFPFFYAGIDSFLNPLAWMGFVPSWIENFGISIEQVLLVQVIFDIAIGVAILFDIFTFWASLAGGAFLLGITILPTITVGWGMMFTLFRDIGLGLTLLGYGIFV